LFWGELEGGMNAKKLVSFNLALKIFENQWKIYGMRAIVESGLQSKLPRKLGWKMGPAKVGRVPK
jgi:hypothetical protein